MTFSLGLATFLTLKTQPNRAKTPFYEAKPCILQCFCLFLSDFRVFGAPGGARAAPGAPQGVPEALQTLLGGPNGDSREPAGVLLERSWRLLRRSRGALDGSWRLLAAPRALPGRFWRSPGARLEPWDFILEPFFFPEAHCFRVLRHRSRNRHRLLVFSFGNSRSTWALALVSRAWACALESWALGRGSWALAWALALGSWALTLGFRVWGLRLFSSGASALRSWALALLRI